ncbi:hypothetical protein [Rhizobium leguminosarum]|uniref:hypothetical protein n=1 Tax=Rhizobium leguminosarum TaxID=384 RepID=UPI003F97D906
MTSPDQGTPMRPMWCDDFDMDLLKVIDGVEELLGDVAGLTLWTHGQPYKGTINSPAMWNDDLGLVCFFGFANPAKPDFYATSAPAIKCTALEAFRDLWSHGSVMLVEGAPVWNSQDLWPDFEKIMWSTRGWGGEWSPSRNQVRLAQLRVRQSLRGAATALRTLAIARGLPLNEEAAGDA